MFGISLIAEKARGFHFAALAIFTAVVCVGCSHNKADFKADSWNRKSAAAYLDYRENWWAGWPRAARDRDTFCVSCHTAVPYAMSRAALRSYLGENSPTQAETNLLQSVRTRVAVWNEIKPYYSERDGIHKGVESRGTEAVLNALILATNDAREGRLSPETRQALDIMWRTQETSGQSKGAWPWLQFDNEPWEASDSEYYGGVLAALAVSMTPGDYQSTREIQPYMSDLKDYLRKNYDSQSLLNKSVLLWTSAKVPGLLQPEQKVTLIKELVKKQRSDGGWSLAPLAWTWKGWHSSSFIGCWLRGDGTWQRRNSDGYATALVLLALRDAGVPRENPAIQRGLSWLARNQDPGDGSWPSSSLNLNHNPSSDVGHFMRDAATAYAVIALTRIGDAPEPSAVRARE